jgi:hypothetical protein
MDVVQKELPTVQEQPTGETPDQALERELRAAQVQIRDVGSVLRDALAEDDRLAALADTPPQDLAQGNQGNQGNQANRDEDGRR